MKPMFLQPISATLGSPLLETLCTPLIVASDGKFVTCFLSLLCAQPVGDVARGVVGGMVGEAV